MSTYLVRQRLVTTFKSPNHPRSQTRQVLRILLRHLRSGEPPALPLPGERGALRDEDMLALFEAIDIRFGNDAGDAEAIYLAALQGTGNEPSWSDIVASGWLREVWGRYHAHYDLYQASGKAPELTALRYWMERRYKDTVTLRSVSAPLPPTLASIASDLVAARQDLRNLTCQDPAWVAARLWDRNWQSAATPQGCLRRWVDQWQALGSPRLTPSTAWAAADLAAFRDTAFAVLENETDLVCWARARERFVRQAARATGSSEVDQEVYFDPMPQGWVTRASWLLSRKHEAFVYHGLEATAAHVALADLLWADVLAEPHAPAPHPIAARLLELAQDRLELTACSINMFVGFPELLADALLYPPSAGLACLAFMQIRGELTHQVIAEELDDAKVSVFADMAGILACLIGNGETPASEGADLLAWFHRYAPPGFIDTNVTTEPMRVALVAELRGLSDKIVKEMITGLIASATAPGFEPSAFATALELAEAIAVDDSAAVDAMATAYIADLSEDHPDLRSNRIGSGSAKAFLNLPFQPTVRQQLLHAVDVRARTAKSSPGYNSALMESRIATALRIHIRILSRAIIGYGTATPADLSDALVDAVEAGAELNPAKGKVAVFAPHFETQSWSQDRPIAHDLAGALRALDQPRRDRLLATILRTDEPDILARLHPNVTPSLRGEIEKRLNELTPEKSAELYSLRDLQARAESLLAAGLPGPASAFLAAERDAKTMGKVPGRELAQLRSDLRLKFLAEDWDGILASVAPPGLSQLDAAEARDALDFYRGLALLLDDGHTADGSEAAEQTFAALLERKPHNRAYALNLFAARVSRLLNDQFGLLDGSGAAKARQLLVENERTMGDRSKLSDDERATLAANETVVFLALGQPERAFATISHSPYAHSDPKALGYQAVALSRLGRDNEAEMVLRTAESLGAPPAFLNIVRANLTSATAVALPVSVTAQEHRVRSVRAAIHDLLRMDPEEQAIVLGPPASTLKDYLTEQVSQAATSLIKLVSVMRAVVLSDCEDDLNAILGELLLSRMNFLKWTTSDQSKGGHSGSGNPGERDLVIRNDASELCIIEAVICEDPITWQRTMDNLRKHFKKLFGYGTSRILFNVIYAYGTDIGALNQFVVNLAESGVIGCDLIGWSKLPASGSRPNGITARYRKNEEEITVVFLVLNMGQIRERAAAAEARSKPVDSSA
jgi:hypothetical protein